MLSRVIPDSSVAERLAWVEKFVRDHSYDRPPFDPATSPKWFSFTPNTIGAPELHQLNNGKAIGGMGADDITYSGTPWHSVLTQPRNSVLTFPKYSILTLPWYSVLTLPWHYTSSLTWARRPERDRGCSGTRRL